MARRTRRPLHVRKLADTEGSERVRRYDPLTGERYLVDPSTPFVPSERVDSELGVTYTIAQHEPWPLAGVEIVDEVPKATRVPTSFVTRGVSEGWIEVEGQRQEHRPGGPAEDPWRLTHTFLHADAVVLKCVDGDVRYRIVHQPDKYDDKDEPSGKRVDWFYDLELED